MPKLSDLFDLNLMAKHLQDRVITCRVRDEKNDPFGFRILNYTAKAQYDNIWDEVTRQCRGLIYDVRNLEVVARPFQKFFNYNDSRHPETHPENLPPYQPFITRKYDGSLGIGYKHNGRWHVATRGSFHSEQAEWATKWLRQQLDANFPDGWTPLFEIVYAANKIVVDYDWEGLVLLGMVNIETGQEITPQGLQFISAATGLRCVESFVARDYQPDTSDCCISELLKENKSNEEGYVLAYHVGDGVPLRCKIKFSDYCSLHRLLHQTSPLTIWEMLRAGKTLHDDIVPSVASSPEPFREWVRSTAARLFYEMNQMAAKAQAAYFNSPPCGTRKAFAEYAKTKGELTPLLFAIIDGKDVTDMVWKMVRPTSAQPFKQEEA